MDNKTRALVVEVTKSAIKEWEHQKEHEKDRKHDQRLRNVKLLLRNYRTFKDYESKAGGQIKGLNKVLDEDLNTDDLAVESILKSKKRTLIMIQHIDRMMEAYKGICETSKNPEHERRYKVVHDLYISAEERNATEIANGHNINRRTVYKDVDAACKTLSVLMFGVDALKLH